MAAVDEVVFHQILGRHRFCDRATPAVGLLSDGMVDHKPLCVHQIRCGVDLLLYDLAGTSRRLSSSSRERS